MAGFTFRIMYHSRDKILPLPGLLARVRSWRLRGQQVVFTNGCFDLLHLGHVDYLERAKALGDRLIIGLNRDVSVRQLKGPGRPLQDETSRARLLAALEFVDAVVLFASETPATLIEAIGPDVLVKGSDYQVTEIAGHEHVLARGGRVETLDFIAGYSTSALIARIHAQAGD